jgi:hypothetical protein
VGDEHGYLEGVQFPGDHVQRHGVRGDEQVAVVPVELGALMLLAGVLDGESVQAEFLADGGQVIGIGRAHVQPHGDARLPDVLGDILHREVLGLENTAAVQPGTCHTGRLEAPRRSVMCACCAQPTATLALPGEESS